MNRNDRFFVLTLAVGVLCGFMMATCIHTARDRSHRMRAEYLNWRKLNLILEQVDRNYVDEPDRKKVTEAAAAAALSALDPHSMYVPPVELEQSEEDLAGGFDGIGVQFNVPNDTAIVIEVIPGGPSEKAGLLQGDRLIKVDDKVIAGVGCPQDTMVRRMRGRAGSKVRITVSRNGEVIPFDITRGKIPTYSVDASFMANDTTGYIRLSKFSRTTSDEFEDAASKLSEAGMKHLIVDIRDNNGGYLDQALKLANMFLEKDSLIVFTEGRRSPRQEYRSDGKGALKDVKLSVLISDGSASSAEIFAGAIQDNGRGTIIGRRSFGKGLVQEPFYFTDGSGIRLTVARFYTPSGRCIQKPYSDDYEYEVLKRYNDGEMVAADSMKVENGGIIPDVFVAIDTTIATQFYVKCNRKATAMRFASSYFDAHSEELRNIGDFRTLKEYLESADIAQSFLDFAESRDGIKTDAYEWKKSSVYMLPQIYALIGRYSKMGDNAFYRLYLDIDDTFKVALTGR
ncbi:MAG: S41 family peptidase [Bacteroidales bacterium]|nr:S41 family peptidase [Bacteroidales bacterium]